MTDTATVWAKGGAGSCPALWALRGITGTVDRQPRCGAWDERGRCGHCGGRP